MFCRKCGAEMSDTAKFCPKCGYERETTVNNTPVEDNEIKLQLKSKFNIPYKVIVTLTKALLYAILIFFIIIDDVDEVEDLLYIYPSIIWIGIGIIAIYVIVKLILEKLQYKDLEYNFYKTKVEYKDGFLNKEEKELKYKYIREVTMNQNILERLFNIGTIRIFTNASSGYTNYNKHNKMIGKNGIYIHCVQNVKEEYKKIKEVIDEGTPEE